MKELRKLSEDLTETNEMFLKVNWDPVLSQKVVHNRFEPFRGAIECTQNSNSGRVVRRILQQWKTCRRPRARFQRTQG
jgi:hypothetical protein